MKILHYMPDDKFLDAAISLFERVAPGLSEYFLSSNTLIEGIKCIKHTDKISGVAPYRSLALRELVKQCSQHHYSAVIFHSIPPCDTILRFKQTGVRIFVLPWGGDLYLIAGWHLYKSKTLLAMLGRDRCFLSPRWIYHKLRSLIVNNPIYPSESVRSFLSVDYLCPVIDEDFMVLKQRFGHWMTAKMLRFNYGDGFESDLKELASWAPEGAIIVGNSETWTNNHLDVFKWLKRLGVQNQILCPLSYGTCPTVQHLVKSEGHRLFGERFEALTKFQPYEQYQKTLSRASYMVMGHLRQQAVGNVWIGMKHGHKLFFYKDNPLYVFLSRLGFAVFCIEDTCDIQTFKTALGEEEKNKNRRLLVKYWGKNILDGYVREIVRLAGE